MKTLWWIRLPYATFGLLVKNGIVIETAPIAGWMMGKEIDEVTAWVYKKNGMVWDRGVVE